MSSKDPEGKVLEYETAEEETEAGSEERTMYLQHGRQLAVNTQGTEELIEVRATSGQVELRIKLTEQGPVMQLDGVRLAIKAAESVDVDCDSFNVEANSVKLRSKGEMQVESEGEMKVRSSDDVRVLGKVIWLN